MRRIWVILALGVGASALANAPELMVNARSAIIVDERSGVILWEKDAYALRYPASTTKIMTALLLLENSRFEEVVTAPKDTEKVEGSSLHLKPGERMSVKDLLYAIMLRSANDACHAYAVHLAGSDAGFAKLMNERADQIGCISTHFATPHGLPNDQHVTTAYDLSLIAREAMKHPDFREVVKTKKRNVQRSINQKDLLVENKNKFLEWDATHDGIKTGFTRAAKGCFVGSATRNGYRFVTVILGSEDWKKDQKAMIDWAFKHYTRSVVFRKGEVIAETPVPNGATLLKAAVKGDVHYAHEKGRTPKLSVELSLNEPVSLPVEPGVEIGKAKLTDGLGWFQEVPVVAAEQVALAPRTAAIASPGWLIGSCLFLGAGYWMRCKSRRLSSSWGRY
jgi:D-alanyl-D-alanine carboxypeptidase (penicillin-binding protein 5/6)